MPGAYSCSHVPLICGLRFLWFSPCMVQAVPVVKVHILLVNLAWNHLVVGPDMPAMEFKGIRGKLSKRLDPSLSKLIC